MILMPPAVEPAQAPINMAKKTSIREETGQSLKLAVTKPVVDMMEQSWKAL